MTQRTRTTSILVLLGTAAFALGACNTLAGVGKDLKKGGEKIEEVVKGVKEKF
ncbi:MAG: entericidin A/B family lipoprotein [Alphaproteobacteria bacterium]|nr:entericidin A/B family lipoprotein [Alphaproteobacteria bacterium]